MLSIWVSSGFMVSGIIFGIGGVGRDHLKGTRGEAGPSRADKASTPAHPFFIKNSDVVDSISHIKHRHFSPNPTAFSIEDYGNLKVPR